MFSKTADGITSAKHINPAQAGKNYWLSAPFLATLVCAGTLTSTTIQAYNFDTIAAFVAPALITHYLSSKRTVAHIRAKAQAMIDDYEQKNVDFTTNDIRWAYDIIKSTDKELENRVWWNSTIKSVMVGAFTAFVYNSFMYPGEKNEQHTHHHTHYYYINVAAPSKNAAQTTA